MTQPTVLIVDDEPSFLQICRIVLQQAGYRPITASDATEAMTYLSQSTTPDALLLDDDMPGMSGSELASRLSQSARYQHLPIIMFSANERVHNPDWLAKIGATDAIKKPCMPNAILDALARTLPRTASV